MRFSAIETNGLETVFRMEGGSTLHVEEVERALDQYRREGWHWVVEGQKARNGRWTAKKESGKWAMYHEDFPDVRWYDLTSPSSDAASKRVDDVAKEFFEWEKEQNYTPTTEEVSLAWEAYRMETEEVMGRFSRAEFERWLRGVREG